MTDHTFEHQIVEALALHATIEARDRQPTSIAHEIYCHGIRLISRYRKADDFVVLMKIAEAVADVIPDPGVTEILCDTEAGCSYWATCQRDPQLVAATIALVCLELPQGGHNGILVDCPTSTANVEAQWLGDVGLTLEEAIELLRRLEPEPVIVPVPSDDPEIPF